MKITEFNSLRSAIYAEGMTHPEIAEAIRATGVCYLYDVMDSTGNHAVLALTARSQLNDSALRAHGIRPETARAALLITYTQRTKCATLWGGKNES